MRTLPLAFGMRFAGLLHVTTAIIAFVLGVLVLSRPKGGQWHNQRRQAFVLLMLMVKIGAFTVRPAETWFGPFRVLGGVSVASVIAGFCLARFDPKSRAALKWHGYFLAWSVAGLAAAAIGQGAAVLSLPVWPSIVLTLALSWIAISRENAGDTGEGIGIGRVHMLRCSAPPERRTILRVTCDPGYNQRQVLV